MAQQSSFVVSVVDMQEVRNAVDQSSREISQRFDFKNTDTSLTLADEAIEMHSATEDRLKAAYQVLQEKAIKRPSLTIITSRPVTWRSSSAR